MKVRVSYLLDLEQIAPDATTEADVIEVVRRLSWNAARVTHLKNLQAVRVGGDSKASKDAQAINHLAAVMFTMMGEANTSIEVIPDGAVIDTRLRLEQGDAL